MVRISLAMSVQDRLCGLAKVVSKSSCDFREIGGWFVFRGKYGVDVPKRVLFIYADSSCYGVRVIYMFLRAKQILEPLVLS